MWMALALIQAAAPPGPLPVAIEEDLTCIAVLSAAVDAAPAAEQAGPIGGLMYYIGRIDQAAPGFDYAGQLGRLLDAKDSDAKIRAAAARCDSRMEAVGAAMERLGAALRRRE